MDEQVHRMQELPAEILNSPAFKLGRLWGAMERDVEKVEASTASLSEFLEFGDMEEDDQSLGRRILGIGLTRLKGLVAQIEKALGEGA